MKPALLYLVHRIPFPPNKGDKVRSFHLLRHLAQKYRVFLGTFVDYEQDWQYVGELDKYCEKVNVEGISPKLKKIMSLSGLVTGEALTLPYYRNKSMMQWVDKIVREQGIERVVIFSSSMAQYVEPLKKVRCVVDFVDVDSAKWTRYADDHKGGSAWLYRREGARLAQFERAVAERSAASVLVSEAEAEMFRHVAPQSVDSVHAIGNGVDADFFSPSHELANPYQATETPVVFTGAMDYWPNINAVTWFVEHVWLDVLAKHSNARFYVVGMNPSEEVRALAAKPGVFVTGTVPDVRPYLSYANVVVAPLQVARGVQNKILEAMSMGRPVIASKTCAVGISAQIDEEFLVADQAAEYLAHLDILLAHPVQGDTIGRHARHRILCDYSWDAHLARFDSLIDPGVA